MSQPIQRVGQYNFLKKLGSGRMAEVYLGRIEGAEGFQKPVAIKKILPHLSSDLQFVQSLIAEARVGGQLHHRNIVEVYDFIRYGNDYCIIMEYVDGVDLGRILRSARRYRVRIPPAAALYIASHICDGLDYAHSARGFNGEPLNIIHRDLKPSNILISIKGGVKISDFGIARVMEQAVQRSPGDVKVSYQYQSPEQATGGMRLTAGSDIFSVGVILFEMLTLEPLFPGKNVLEVLEGLREADFSRRLDLAQRQLPGSEKILATALDPDPDQRYRTARMMAEDIRRLLLYLKVDDPRERLVTFFARLVRFVQEQGKRPPAKRSGTESASRQAAGHGETGSLSDAGEEDAAQGERGTDDGEMATISQDAAGQVPSGEAPAAAASVSDDAVAPAHQPQAPPPPGAFSTHAPPSVSASPGGDAPGGGEETPILPPVAGAGHAGTELEMPMPSACSSDQGAEAGDGGFGAGGGEAVFPGASAAPEPGSPDVPEREPTAMPGEGQDVSLASGTPTGPDLPVDFNPEETRIGSYATVEPATVPLQSQPQPVASDDATRILPVGDVPSGPESAPGTAAPPATSRAFDDTVDSGDSTAVLPAAPNPLPARPGGGRRILLLGLGMVAVLAVGGGSLAVWQHMKTPADVVDADHKQCPVCGHVLPADAVFCSFCGANLDTEGQQGGEEAIVKCPYCGADNDPGAAYCANCGKKLPNH